MDLQQSVLIHLKKKKEIERKRRENEVNRRKAIKKAYKVVYNTEECIKACRGEVEVNTFEPLAKYMELGNRFFNAVPEAINKIANNAESWTIIPDLRRKTFKRIGDNSSYDNEKDMTVLIRAELIGGVSENKIKRFIAAMADQTMDYIRHSDQIIKNLNEKEKKATDSLNKLLRVAQTSNDDKKISLVQKLASFIGQFVNALVGQIKQSRDAADAVAEHAVAMYREQVRRANGKY